ncbi:MAG: FAD-binding oxidoreductase [Ferrimicrobium sp.]|jgi:glycolate oxidase FAD binding subunit|nr:FAD-binding oxidoreductase [Ferrimicrobium sp.]
MVNKSQGQGPRANQASAGTAKTKQTRAKSTQATTSISKASPTQSPEQDAPGVELVTPQDIGELVAWLRGLDPGIKIRAQGLGTNQLEPLDDRVIVNTQGFDRIEHRVEDFSVSVGAGVAWDQLQARLASTHQRIAIDGPEPGTVGAMVATGARGGLIHRWGPMRDQIIGMTVVLADGTVAHSGGTVIKNVAGYDLAKLFTNARGRYGIITEVVFRTHPLPPTERTLVVALASWDASDRSVAIGEVHEIVTKLRGSMVALSAMDLAGGLLFSRIEGDQAVIESRVTRLQASLGTKEVTVLDHDESLAHWRALTASQSPVVGSVVVGITARSSHLISILDEIDRDCGVILGDVVHLGAGVAEVTLSGTGLSEQIEPMRSSLARAGAGMELRASNGVMTALSSDRFHVEPNPLALSDTAALHRYRQQPQGTTSGPSALVQAIAQVFDPDGRFS